MQACPPDLDAREPVELATAKYLTADISMWHVVYVVEGSTDCFNTHWACVGLSDGARKPNANSLNS